MLVEEGLGKNFMLVDGSHLWFPSMLEERADSMRCRTDGEAPVVLMVSGGADSTALVVLAVTSQLDIDDGRGAAKIAHRRLHILHVNHCLRTPDAEKDEKFVRSLAARFAIPCTVIRADIGACARGGSHNIENEGRKVRYAQAERLADKLSAASNTPYSSARIVTAHTADDRAETFFINAVRGAGLTGLSSIPYRRGRIVRPLLGATHKELCDLLRRRGDTWREDLSNADTHYLRSFVRHTIVPLARKRNPHVIESLAVTCDLLSKDDAYLARVAETTRKELTCRFDEGNLVLDARKLAGLDLAVARRVIRDAVRVVCPDCRLGARHIAAVLAIVSAGSGSCTLPSDIDVRINYGRMFVHTRFVSDTPTEGWLPVPGSLVLFNTVTFTAQLVPVASGINPVDKARVHAQQQNMRSVLLDAHQCGIGREGGQLWVDRPRSGDKFLPFGMQGRSKKVSNLLIDGKIALCEREKIGIVRKSPAGSIVWVAGIRPDERVCCTSRTELLVQLDVRWGSDDFYGREQCV